MCSILFQVAIGAAGGIDLLLRAMREHPYNGDLQESACLSLCNLIPPAAVKFDFLPEVTFDDFSASFDNLTGGGATGTKHVPASLDGVVEKDVTRNGAPTGITHMSLLAMPSCEVPTTALGAPKPTTTTFGVGGGGGFASVGAAFASTAAFGVRSCLFVCLYFQPGRAE